MAEKGLKMTHFMLYQQVTRGHNIVADGWAGASNPHPHLMPPPSTPKPKKASKTLVFQFSTRGLWTNGRTDGRTDKASYRVACPQLKRIERKKERKKERMKKVKGKKGRKKERKT